MPVLSFTYNFHGYSKEASTDIAWLHDLKYLQFSETLSQSLI